MEKKTLQILRDYKLKVTDARVALLNILQTVRKPVDIQQIKLHLQKSDVVTDEATIYRILNIFVEKGIVNQIQFQESKHRYELAELPHHHHAVCTKCGTICDIENCEIDSLQNTVQKNFKFTINTHRVELFGLCQNCS